MSLIEKLTSIKANLNSAMIDINTALVAKGASEVTTLYDVPTAIENIQSGGGGTNSSIHRVSALPKTANEGDIVYYCPPPNTLTSADSNRKVHINFSEIERLMEDVLKNSPYPIYDWHISFGDKMYDIVAGSLGVYFSDISYDTSTPRYGVSLFSQFSNMSYCLWWDLNEKEKRFKFSEELSTVSRYNDDYSAEVVKTLSQLCDSFPIGTITNNKINVYDNGDTNYKYDDYGIFQAEPRFYQYTNGAWQETELPQLQ